MTPIEEEYTWYTTPNSIPEYKEIKASDCMEGDIFQFTCGKLIKIGTGCREDYKNRKRTFIQKLLFAVKLVFKYK